MMTGRGNVALTWKKDPPRAHVAGSPAACVVFAQRWGGEVLIVSGSSRAWNALRRPLGAPGGAR